MKPFLSSVVAAMNGTATKNADDRKSVVKAVEILPMSGYKIMVLRIPVIRKA